MSNTNRTEHETKPPSRAMTEWLERQYDATQAVNCGPEALAWDEHGLREAGQRLAANV